MNNLNYDGIYDILNKMNLPLVIIVLILGLAILFLISKILIKAGLFLLVMTFIFDFIMRVLPIDIYQNYPSIKLIINILYALGFFIFAYKNIKRIMKNKRKKELFKDKNLIPEVDFIKIFYTYLQAYLFYLWYLQLYIIHIKELIHLREIQAE